MKCLVSGATGFIGRELCRQLRGSGHELIAWSKSGARLADGTPTRALDLATERPVAAWLEGVDVVFHLAGVAHQRAPEATYRDLNHLATLALATCAAAAGVKRFVYLSSVKAMGPAGASEQRDERVCNPPADAYGRSKWQAECDLRATCSGAAMAIIVIRPALVFGAGVKGNLATLARAAGSGLPRPPPGGARSMIALQDLVELLCVAGTGPVPAGDHTWIACDGRAYTTREIYEHMRRGLGRGPGVAWLPRWGWWLAATVRDLLSGDSGESTYHKLFGTELYSNARVLADTGWRPRHSLEEAIPALLGRAVSAQP